MNTLQHPRFDNLSMELALELNDPGGRLATDPALAARQHEFVGYVFELYGVEIDSSTELLPALACDAVESGLCDEDEIVARARVIGAEQLVVPSLQGLLERTRRQAAGILDSIDIEKAPMGKRALVAADHIAQISYAGKLRKSGEPYYTHPKRAAAMGLYIFNQLEKEGYTIEPDFKKAVLSVALLHDATEETIRSCKYYDPDRPEGFSPLLVHEIFRQTGNPHGGIVANSLRLMTHYAKLPWAPDYRTYVTLGSSDFIFDLVKPLDMYDNLRIEPKPITVEMGDDEVKKIQDKQALYEACIEMLAINAPRRTGNAHNRIWARRYFDILRTINPGDLPDMVQALDVYIYGDWPEHATGDSMQTAA